MHKKEKVARIVKAINEIKEQENEERDAKTNHIVCINGGQTGHRTRSDNRCQMYEIPSETACQTCGIIWQRDINAAKNIQEIAESEIIDEQGRPSAFERPTRTNK